MTRKEAYIKAFELVKHKFYPLFKIERGMYLDDTMEAECARYAFWRGYNDGGLECTEKACAWLQEHKDERVEEVIYKLRKELTKEYKKYK